MEVTTFIAVKIQSVTTITDHSLFTVNVDFSKFLHFVSVWTTNSRDLIGRYAGESMPVLFKRKSNFKTERYPGKVQFLISSAFLEKCWSAWQVEAVLKEKNLSSSRRFVFLWGSASATSKPYCMCQSNYTRIWWKPDTFLMTAVVLFIIKIICLNVLSFEWCRAVNDFTSLFNFACRGFVHIWDRFWGLRYKQNVTVRHAKIKYLPSKKK